MGDAPEWMAPTPETKQFTWADLKRAGLTAPQWQQMETAPKDEWILLGYTQQGDEMPDGLMVGVGMYFSSGKIWTMNANDNEKALPNYWMPLPEPPR